MVTVLEPGKSCLRLCDVSGWRRVWCHISSFSSMNDAGNSAVLVCKNFKGSTIAARGVLSSTSRSAVRDRGRQCWGPGLVVFMHSTFGTRCGYTCVGKG